MITAVVSAITALLVVIPANGLGRLLETRRRHDKALEATPSDTTATSRPNAVIRGGKRCNQTIGTMGRRMAEFPRLFTLNTIEHFGALRHAAA